MPGAVAVKEAEPLAAINITPLIDVMLVLLIMMILTIPIATHKLPIDLPNGQPAPLTGAMPHRLDIARNGALAWDGRAITDRELPTLLAASVRDSAVLHLKTDPAASYRRFNAVLAVVKRAGVTRLGFIGNERMRM
ncbi:MAG: biopolymer transporter ExbD [Sphingomonas sp.]|nr:biopolymer transporter ExbD [Sphingomonas sp.]